MKYIVHIKCKGLKEYIPTISFNDYLEALNYVDNYIKCEQHFNNFLPLELKTWLWDNKPLIEESITGKFEIMFK